MANLDKIPLIDGFETTLAQLYTGGLGTMYVNDTPAFTFPSGVKTYAVVNPGKSIQQVVEIDAKGAGTINVSSITVEKGAGVNYTAQTHSAGNKVIISDNYQFWKDIRTAINTKLDQDGGNGVDYADTTARDAALGGNGVATKNYRNIKAGSTYYNYNLSLGQWQSISTGTAPANASVTGAGVVEAPTLTQQQNGTTVGETWALLFSTPDYVKTVNDTAVAEALKIKSKVDVRLASTANVASITGLLTIDSVVTVAGNRVLLKDQSTASQNGIYIVAAGAWTRATDFDANTNNEVDLGADVWVSAGSVNIGKRYTLTTTGAITVWSTNLTFTQTYPGGIADISARVGKTANQTMGFGYTTITWDTESYDTSTMHDNVTNNSRITIPALQGGKYLISANINSNSTSGYNIKMLLNGATQIGLQNGNYMWSGSDGGGSLSILYSLSAGDYIEVQSNNSVVVLTTSSFAIQKLI